MDSQSEKYESSSAANRTGPSIFNSSKIAPDPVKEQKRKEQREKPKKKESLTKQTDPIQIVPSMGTRIDLHAKAVDHSTVVQPHIKYIPPKPKIKKTKEEKEKEKKEKKERALQEEQTKICNYDVIRIPSSVGTKKVDINLTLQSPEVSQAKVFPRKPSASPSDQYPDPPDKEELNKSKPKSGIFINETKDESQIAEHDYDSFDLVYKREPREHSTITAEEKSASRKNASRKRRRHSSTKGAGSAGDATPSKQRKVSKHTKDKSKSKSERENTTMGDSGLGDSFGKSGMADDSKGGTSGMADISEYDPIQDASTKVMEDSKLYDDNMGDYGDGVQEIEDAIIGDMAEEGEGVDQEVENYLTKLFRRKVSQLSKSTSYQSRDLRSQSGEEEEELPQIPNHKIVQKFRRDSDIARYRPPKKRKLKRGTLQSHSFTNLKQTTLKSFYFGSKCGSMHQGDEHFPESIRNKQGICMSVAAFCYALLIHPNKWTEKVIDSVLEAGTDLFIDSSKNLHIHEHKRELKPEDLEKYCYVCNKKVRFTVSEPIIAGMVRSDEINVYNLSKGLTIFFSLHRVGIFKTTGVNIAIWRDKHYYFFDASPRTRDLYPDLEGGYAILANFYDVPSVVTVLLERSNLGNTPYVIYSLEAYKIYDKDEVLMVDSEIGMDERSNYNILDDKKAVVVGSFDLADKCFDFTRKKQALAMAVVCLVYSRITPPSAWQRRTIDKIMTIGNQLYLECVECADVVELTLANLPAVFTIGPYLVEIYIYANRFVDLMFKKGSCRFHECLVEFFQKNTNGIVQIGKYTLAIWKQRNMFFCFDPYSRNNEGVKCRDGGACVSMHANEASLVDLVTFNFEQRDVLFFIHAMKVCKIHRDPAQASMFPRNMSMNDYPCEDFKKYKMIKSKRPATEKEVTVDQTTLAMRTLGYGESPDASIMEMGSNIMSLTMDQIPPMMHKYPLRQIFKTTLPKEDQVADLDSPSLSDTQIEPPQVLPEEEIEFVDLEDFELTQEEIELESRGEKGEGGEGKEKGEGDDEEGEEDEEAGSASKSADDGGSGDREETMEKVEKEMEKMAGEGEGEDWYMAMANFTQMGSEDILRSKISIEINTDLTYFPIPEEIVYPTPLKGRQDMMRRMEVTMRDSWDDVEMIKEPEVTQSEELAKESNFVELPDNTELLRGSKNMADFGQELEFMAPFVCIMAIAVARKYAIISWSKDIVDYVLKCGAELHKASKVRYDQVSKLEIPKVALGKTNFSVKVKYLFDTYMKQNIVELALGKILFVRYDSGVLVTPTYACAVFFKNHLYYLYDGFGNNEVGLSEGMKNKGTACFARFKDIHSLATRIMYNKQKRESSEQVEFTRFVISSVQVKPIRDEEKPRKKRKSKDRRRQAEMEQTKEAGEGGDDMDFVPEEEEGEEIGEIKDEDESVEKEPENKVGYQRYRGVYTIKGTTGLEGRATLQDTLKEDHFVCLYASLMLVKCPVHKWDTRRMDKTIEQGKHMYSHAENVDMSDKRVIKNILVGTNYFDVIVKQIKIMNWKDNKTIGVGIDTLLGKKHQYFLIQFTNACYLLHVSSDGYYHLFDPYGSQKNGKPAKSGGKATWQRFKNIKKLKRRIIQSMVEGGESYRFYNYEVTSIRKAPKSILLEHKLQKYELHKKKKPEVIEKPFYEDIEWLEMDPIPWSLRNNLTACGYPRYSDEGKWHDWSIEYPKDLFSLHGSVHQNSRDFDPQTRGKQTLANLVIATAMLDIYILSEWNYAIIDSVLVNGDNYCKECIKDIKDDDYELSMDDLMEDASIFPYSFKVSYDPVVQGTMFIMRLKQFNLYKGLRYFFDNYESRCGIIIATKNDRKRQVAFGKVKQSEYYMFDSEAFGPPMFLERRGVAYILRMTTLNRLLHVLTLTLRGGDYFIYEIEITDMQPIS